MKKLLYIFPLILASCSTTPITNTVSVPTTFYPNVPAIKSPPPINYYPLSFMLPVGSNNKVMNLTTVCPQTLSKTEMDACLSANINSTNLYVGLDEKNYTYLLLNLKLTQEYIAELKARISAANSIFAYWTSKNTQPVKGN
jgi:hypothetical protein